MTLAKTKHEYRKKCWSCGKTYTSNYYNSNPCASCGSSHIIITHKDGKPVHHSKRSQYDAEPASPAKPVIERTVIETWKGDVYKLDYINGESIEKCQAGLNANIKKRDEINKQINAARLRLAWHAKRKAKGAFE